MDYYERKRDPSLVRIIVILVVIGGVGAAGWTLARRLPFRGIGGAGAAPAADTLRVAQELYQQGDLDAARKHLAGYVPSASDEHVGAQALVLMAHIEAAGGLEENAAKHLQQVLEQFPNSPEVPGAAVEYGRVLERGGKFEDAVEQYRWVVRTASPKVRAPALSGLGREAERQRDWQEARTLFTQAAEEASPRSEAWEEAIAGLGRVNVGLIFSPGETPDSKVHVVAPGDSITSIGNSLNTTQALLIRANNLADPTKLNVGQRLKYTPKDFSIVIERSTCRLFLLDKGGIFKSYLVGLGRPGKETTLGRYKIGNKQVDPTWFKPGYGPIPPGHPENELGTRWMPLVPIDEGLPTDLGIHGTIAPPTIGDYASSGCPRMYPEDVEELYDLVVRATPVEIVEEFDLNALTVVAGG